MSARAPTLTILVDRREQRPWEWTGTGITVEAGTLATGDYSVVGFADRMAIERKSLDDLVHTVIHDSTRWHAEVRRLADLDASCVVVEAGLPDLFARHYTGQADPRSVLGRVLSVELDFHVPVIFAGDRPHARVWATMWLARAARRCAQSH